MRYWWVNQKQTYRHEISGGYLWSPKRNANGARNRFYDNMREVSPGDIIFSYVNARIHAVGVAKSFAYECPKPHEFGSTGMYWEKVGWRVDVTFAVQPTQVRPKEYIELLRPLLPERYAPLSNAGDGLQNVYLAHLPTELAEALASIVSGDVLSLVRGQALREPEAIYGAVDQPAPALVWEEELARQIREAPSLVETEKRALILARRGQGIFKSNVLAIERRCRITEVDQLEHLRASHCRPWRDSNNLQRLDGDNGLLLTPSIDHLFDRGFISFEDDGRLIVSPVAHQLSLQRMGVETTRAVNVGSFTQGQKIHLQFHRDSVLLAAAR